VPPATRQARTPHVASEWNYTFCKASNLLISDTRAYAAFVSFAISATKRTDVPKEQRVDFLLKNSTKEQTPFSISSHTRSTDLTPATTFLWTSALLFFCTAVAAIVEVSNRTLFHGVDFRIRAPSIRHRFGSGHRDSDGEEQEGGEGKKNVVDMHFCLVNLLSERGYENCWVELCYFDIFSKML